MIVRSFESKHNFTQRFTKFLGKLKNLTRITLVCIKETSGVDRRKIRLNLNRMKVKNLNKCKELKSAISRNYKFLQGAF